MPSIHTVHIVPQQFDSSVHLSEVVALVAVEFVGFVDADDVPVIVLAPIVVVVDDVPRSRFESYWPSNHYYYCSDL